MSIVFFSIVVGVIVVVVIAAVRRLLARRRFVSLIDAIPGPPAYPIVGSLHRWSFDPISQLKAAFEHRLL